MKENREGMFQDISIYLNKQKQEYQSLKVLFLNTPLEQSFDFILQQINQDLNKIIQMSEEKNENYL